MIESSRIVKRHSLDIWFEPLTVSAPYFQACWTLLDNAERTKAQRFVREIDRRRYVVSHGKLRKILAGYVKQAPEELVFYQQVYGKPSLQGDEIHQIKFNLAHSGDHMLVGVNIGDEIGVDIEAWKELPDYPEVIKMCFADSEREAWAALNGVQQQRFFYRLWARKESFIKAVGIGFGLDVSQVVSTPSGPGRFISLPHGYGAPDTWRLIDLELSESYSGAVTAPIGCNPDLCYRRLEIDI